MIKIHSLSKKYAIYAKPSARLKEMLSLSHRQYHKEFWALKDINLTIPDGTTFGIIGANGAGKSTLLKILAGITMPTLGTFELSGRVASLLELGTGFHPEFTGRQNIIINAKMLGLSDEEIHEKIEKIITFAEIGEFIDQPIRTYSSGMYVRLGFAIASCVNPKILLIDEALSVGDAYFQQKCIKRIRKFKEEGATILFVTHNPSIAKTLCDRVALLDEGKIIDEDKPEYVLEHYNALVAKKIASTIHVAEPEMDRLDVPASHRFGNFQAIIQDLQLLNDRGEKQEAIVAGQKVIIAATIIFLSEITDPTFGILIRDQLGNDVFGTNTYHLGIQMGQFTSGDSLQIRFNVEMNLGPGLYTLTVAAHTLDMHIYECFDWADRILSFKVIPSSDFSFIGVAKFYPTIEFTRKSQDINNLKEFINQFFADAPPLLEMSDATQKFLRSGWYAPEKVEKSWIRWTTREFSFLLKTSGKRLMIDFSCCKPDLNQHPMSGKLFCFNDEMANFSIRDQNKTTLEVVLPELWQNRILLFRVKMNADWCPNEYFTNQDMRHLGIAVSKIFMDN
jgi:lipopolysaccharide transport system ATP-binding protein